MPPTDIQSPALNLAAKPGPSRPTDARSASDPQPISFTALALVIVLLLHAALLVAGLLPGPRWMAGLESLFALMAGLSQLRQVAQAQEAPDAQRAPDQGMGMARPSLRASRPRIMR